MKKLITLTSLIMALGSAAFAADVETLQVRELSKKATAKITAYNDAIALNITYVGSSTQAVVYVASGSLTTYVPGPAATQDLNYNLANTLYDTMGELCDAIDADDDYTCDLIDAKRDDSSILTQNSALSNSDNAKAAGGFNVLIDSGCVELLDGTQFELRLGITPESGKRVVLKYCIGNVNVADSLRVWGKLAKYQGTNDGVTRDDTTLVYKAVTADDTDKTIGNVYGVPWMEFAKDAHVVIGSYDNDNAQATGTNTLECVWDEK